MLLGRNGPDGTRIEHVLAGPNRHRDPRTAFELDAGFVAAVLRRHGERLVGFWHSHPSGDARPSASDRATAWPGTWTLIVGLGGRQPEARAYLATRGGGLEEGLLAFEDFSRPREATARVTSAL